MKKNEMLKNGIKVIKKKGLHYIVEDGGKMLQFKPWLVDAFSFLYDFIMKSSIFPKKFGGDMSKHYEILMQELKGIHGKRILELATERNKVQSTIRGTLYSEEELERICKEHGLSYETIPFENGALLYFRAIIQ